jgi:5-methylcytosine-specific restriction endonuclease McrA
VRDLTLFARDASAKDGLQRTCKPCQQAYRDANRERSREYHREHRATHRDKKRAQDAAYYQKTRTQFLAKCAAYRAAHPQKIKARKRAHYEKNGEAIRAKVAAYKAANPKRGKEAESRWRAENKDRVRLVAAIWVEANRARVRAYKNAWGRRNKTKRRLWSAKRRAQKRAAMVVRITVEGLRGRMAVFGNRCAYCGGPFEHVEHVIALARGGPHILANLRPSCGPCNDRKGAMDHRRWFTLVARMRNVHSSGSSSPRSGPPSCFG